MLYFDDVAVGDVFKAGPFQLSEDQIVDFASTWDPFDFHTDIEAAEASIYRGLTAPGILTLCIATRLGHDFEPMAVQALFSAEYRLPNPARVGDELTVHRTITDSRESKSRPDAGIIQTKDSLINQAGELVLEQTVAILVSKRPIEG